MRQQIQIPRPTSGYFSATTVAACDGFRALLEIGGKGARLVSRNRNRFRHLDTLAAAFARRLRVTDAMLDGEVICADETEADDERGELLKSDGARCG